MDPVVHFELPTTDIERAMRFYHDAFGWKLHRPPGIGFAFAETAEMDPATHAPREKARINGSLLVRTGPIQHPVVTIKVANLDAAIAAATGHGGKLVLPPRDVGPVLSAYIQDTEGNIVGLVQDKPR
jgi:hypothetical protein